MLILDEYIYLVQIALMARPIRIEYEGAVYHVTIRANERKPVQCNHNSTLLIIDSAEKPYFL